MSRYALIKHYRGAPASENDVPMSGWTDDEVTAHVDYMERFADRLRESGEFVESHALSDDAVFINHRGQTRPVPEDRALVAGWMVIDVADWARAEELAAELAAAPGRGGEPVGEWLELRPLYGQTR